MPKNKKSSLNILPVILVVALILGAGYFLLKDTLNLPWFKNSKTIEVTRIEGFPRSIDTDKDLKKQRLVIKSQEELRGFLNYVGITDDSTINQTASKINFGRNYAVAVSSDLQEETEGLYRIKRIINDKDDNTLKVSIIQYKPGPTCTPEVKNNVLVDIVAIDKTDKNFAFDSVKETKKCD